METMTTVSVGVAADQDRKGPGRPRSARVDEAIVEAVFELLSSGQSADAISIEAVAAEAGGGKAAIYRRLPNKEAPLIGPVAAVKGPLPGAPREAVGADP